MASKRQKKKQAAKKAIDTLLNAEYKEFQGWDKSQLKSFVKTLSQEGNRRLQKLEHTGEARHSPAYRAQRDKGSKKAKRFGREVKNKAQLRSEFIRIKHFLEAPSSTVEGARDVWRSVQEAINQKANIAQNKIEEMFDVYDELAKIDPTITDRQFRYTVMEEISKVPEDLSHQEKLAYMQNRIEKIYIAWTEENRRKEDYGVEIFF